MKLTLVRHGRTDRNDIKRLQGHTDVPLNHTGLGQAQAAAQALRHEPFDAIITSDLLRASQTADAIARFHSDIDIIRAPDLREKHLGIFEGKITDEICQEYNLTSKEEYYTFVDSHHSVETVDSIYSRIFLYLDDVVKRYNNACIVSHSGAIKIIREYLTGTYSVVSPYNCSISRYNKSVDGWNEEVFGKVSHLEQ